MKPAQRAMWNTGLTWALNLTQRGAGALAFVAIGRLSTISDAGIFSLALGYLAILTTLFTSLDDILVRECARASGPTSTIVVTYTLIRAALGIAGWALLGFILAGLSLYSAGDLMMVAVITSSILLDIFSGIAQAVLNAHGRFGWPLVAAVIGMSVKLSGVLWVLVSRGSLLALALAWPLGSAFTAFILVCILYLHLLRHEKKLELKFDRTWAKQLMHMIPAFVAVSLFSGLEYQLDVILLSVLLSKHEVALYSAAVMIMMVVLTVSQAYRAVLYPAMVRSLAHRPHAAGQLVRRSLLIMGGLALPAVAVISVLAPSIVPLLFGARFAESAPILQTLIWNGVLFFLNVPLVRFMLASDGQSAVWRTVLVSLTVNIIANLLAIPHLGAFGPAYARLASSSVFCGLMAWQVFGRLRRFPYAQVAHGT